MLIFDFHRCGPGFVLGCMLAVVAAGCQGSSSAPKPAPGHQAPVARATKQPAQSFKVGVIPEGPIAVVNGRELPRAQFMALYELKRDRHSSAGGEGPLTARVDRRYRENLMSRMVYAELLRQESERLNVDYDPADLEAEFAELKAGISDWLAMLRRTGETEESRRQMIEVELREKAILKKLGKLEITDELIEAAYQKRRPRYHDDQARLRAASIIVRLEPPGDKTASVASVDAATKAQWKRAARKRAKQLHGLAAAKGADFREIARQRSEGYNASTGGDMEIFNAGQIDPAVAKVIFKMKVGQVSKPIESIAGYTIVKVLQRFEPGYLPKSAVLPTLKRKVMKVLLGAGRGDLRKRLEQQAKIDWRLLPKPKSKTLPHAVPAAPKKVAAKVPSSK